jgi:hypothetical protein
MPASPQACDNSTISLVFAEPSVVYRREIVLPLKLFAAHHLQNSDRGAIGSFCTRLIDAKQKRRFACRPLLKSTNYQGETAQHIESLHQRSGFIDEYFD